MSFSRLSRMPGYSTEVGVGIGVVWAWIIKDEHSPKRAVPNFL
jgi:hypothetical protein